MPTSTRDTSTRTSTRPARVLAFVALGLGVLLTSCFGNPYDDPDSAAARAEATLGEDDVEDTSRRRPNADTNLAFTGDPVSEAQIQQPEQAPKPAEPKKSSQERAVEAVSGKGQYLWHMEQIGTPAQVVEKAKAAGLNHLLIRAGNPDEGFYVKDTLNELVPLAHAAGVKVVAYDGPAMEDIPGDVARALEIVNYTTPSGDRVDALAADIELSRAINLDNERAAAYSALLRESVGPDYPLIAIVMNPNYHEANSNYSDGGYPFAQLAAGFDVLSPMDYWTGVTDDGAAFISQSIDMLAKYGKPVSVIGQAYPIEVELTYPPADRVQAAMQAAKDTGAVGMSFWSWETTRADTWAVIDGFSW